jgi:hypothetical protein
MDTQSNPDLKETQEANQAQSQEETIQPLFKGVDSQGKERLFTNTEEAQQSWQSAQNFIKDTVADKKSLESRIQELEAQLNQSTKLDDALKQLNTKEESPVNEEQTQQATETTPQLDVDQLTQQITESILGKLTSDQQKEVFGKNEQESISAAKAVYGDSFEEKLRQSAKDLGMSDADILKEAQSNPKRFKKLFNLDRQQKTNYTPNGSVSGFPQSKDLSIDFSRGFTAKQRVSTSIDNYRKIAEARGIKLDF